MTSQGEPLRTMEATVTRTQVASMPEARTEVAARLTVRPAAALDFDRQGLSGHPPQFHFHTLPPFMKKARADAARA